MSENGKKEVGLHFSPLTQLIAAIVAGVVILGLLIAVICVAVSAGGKKPEQVPPPAFNAPQNVTVSDGELSWDAVEGATAGYTIRINGSNDKIVGVSGTAGTTLDLNNPIIYKYFSTGNNDLAVKVNGTDKKTESAYATAAQQYNYTGSNEGEEEDTRPRIAMPGNVHIDGDYLKWDAVADATNGYIVFSTEEDSEPYATTATQVDLYDADVQAALGIVPNQAGTYELGVKVAETTTRRESKPYYVFHYIAEVSAAQVQTAYAVAKEAILAFKDELPTLGDDASAETIRARIVAFNATYASDKTTYPDYAKIEDVAEAYTELQELLKDAEEQIEATVADLIESITDNITASYTSITEQARTAYATMVELQEALEGLGAYGKLVLAEEDNTLEAALAQKIESMLALPDYDKTVSYNKVVMNNDDATSDGNGIYVVRQYKNMNGVVIALAAQPTLTYNTTEQLSLTYSSELKTYSVKIPFERAASETTITFTVEGDKTSTPYTFTPSTADLVGLCFNNGGLFSGDTFSFQGGNIAHPFTVELFPQGAVTYAGNNVVIGGMPLATCEITATNLSLSDLKRVLAPQNPTLTGIEFTEVTFAVSQTWTEGSAGATTTYISAINKASTSVRASIKWEEDDRRLPLAEKMTDTWTLVASNDANYVDYDHGSINNGIRADLWKELQIQVFVQGEEDEAPFATIAYTTIGPITWPGINTAIQEAWNEKNYEQKERVYDFTFGMQLIVSDEAKANGYLDSTVVMAKADGEYATKHYDMGITLQTLNVDQSIDTDADRTFSLIVVVRSGELIDALNQVDVGYTIEKDTGDGSDVTNLATAQKYLRMKVQAVDEDGTELFATYTPLVFRGYTMKEFLEEWARAYFTETGDTEDKTFSNFSIKLSFVPTETVDGEPNRYKKFISESKTADAFIPNAGGNITTFTEVLQVAWASAPVAL